jgi:hypothetical protein
MGRFFLDAAGNYYEAITDISVPEGHTPVAQRRPSAEDDRVEQMRAERNERLRESDTDVLRLFLGENLPVPQEWRNYRQALRDLPEQINPSAPVVFPGKPRL